MNRHPYDNRYFLEEIEAIQIDERHRAFVWRSLILLLSIALMGSIFIAGSVHALGSYQSRLERDVVPLWKAQDERWNKP